MHKQGQRILGTIFSVLMITAAAIAGLPAVPVADAATDRPAGTTADVTGLGDGITAQVTQINGCTAISEPGTYELTADVVNSTVERTERLACIKINSSDVVLDGNGHTLDGTDQSDVQGVLVRHDGKDLTNITVRDLTVTDWRNGIEFSENGGVPFPKDTTDVRVENTTAQSNVGNGINFRGEAVVRNIDLIDNRVRSNGDSGIEFVGETAETILLADNVATANGDRGIEAFADNVTLRANTMVNNSGQGIRVGGDNVLVVGNNATANGGRAGIQISSESEDGNNTLIDNIAIANNNGIETDGNDVDLINNTARENDRQGIGVGTFGDLDTDTNSTVINNTATGNGIGGSGAGILLGSDSRNYTVRNNTVFSNQETGINNNGNNNTLIGNTVTANRRGIAIDGDNNVVTDNFVAGSDRFGIKIAQRHANNTLRRNAVRANDGSGILLREGANLNRLVDNMITSNGEDGIRLDGDFAFFVHNNTLINNTASANDKNGILLESSANNTLVDNTANANERDGIRLGFDVRDNVFTDNTAVSNDRWAFATVGSENENNSVVNLTIAATTAVSFRAKSVGLKAGLPRPGDPDALRDLNKYVNVSSTLRNPDPSDSWVVLNTSYTDSEVADLNESDLRMFRFNGTVWNRVLGRNTVDTTQNVVSANVTNISSDPTLVTIFDKLPTQRGFFIESVSPRVVRNPDAFTVTVTGSGLGDASVELVSPSGQRVTPTDVSRGTIDLKASFSLTDPAVGVWRLTVTTPGERASAPVFIAPKMPLVETRAFWPDRVIPGRQTEMRVRLHNRGRTGGVAIVMVQFANATEVRGITGLGADDQVLVNRSDRVILAKTVPTDSSARIRIRYRLSPESVVFPGQEPNETRTVRIGESIVSGHVVQIGTLTRSEWRQLRDSPSINVTSVAVNRTTSRLVRTGAELNRSAAEELSQLMRATSSGPAGAYLALLSSRLTESGWIIEPIVRGSQPSQEQSVSTRITEDGSPRVERTQQIEKSERVQSTQGPGGGGPPTTRDTFEKLNEQLCKELPGKAPPVGPDVIGAAAKTKLGAEAARRLAFAGVKWGGTRFAGTFSTVALRAGQVAKGANAVGLAVLAFDLGWWAGKGIGWGMNQHLKDELGEDAPTYDELLGKGIFETYPDATQGLLDVVNGAKDAKNWVTSLFGESDARGGCSQQQVTTSIDPNDLSAQPVGVGDANHITADQRIRYRVRFENLENATAAAKDVTVTVPVDSALQFDSIETRGSSHPDVMNVTTDPASRTVTWEFSNIDLPPNENPPEGEGFVEFTARPRANPSSGTTITENASIQFEFNPPIKTNNVTRTIDTAPPDTRVGDLSSPQPTEFSIPWTGGDEPGGSGIQNVTLLAAKGNESLEGVARTNESTFTFQADSGGTYRFATVGQDRVGNIESLPADADTTVEVMGPEDPVERFDANNDGEIDFDELTAAAEAFALAEIDFDALTAVAEEFALDV